MTPDPTHPDLVVLALCEDVCGSVRQHGESLQHIVGGVETGMAGSVAS